MQNTQTLRLDGTKSPEVNPNGSPLPKGLSEAKLGDIVEVIWDDAWDDHDLEEDTSRWPTEKRINSIGVLRRIRPVVSISQDACPVDGIYQQVTNVPHPYIQEVVIHARP